MPRLPWRVGGSGASQAWQSARLWERGAGERAKPCPRMNIVFTLSASRVGLESSPMFFVSKNRRGSLPRQQARSAARGGPTPSNLIGKIKKVLKKNRTKNNLYIVEMARWWHISEYLTTTTWERDTLFLSSSVDFFYCFEKLKFFKKLGSVDYGRRIASSF